MCNVKLVKIKQGESLRGVVAHVPDFDIIVGKFELKLRYYIHLITNSLEKYISPINSQLWFK